MQASELKNEIKNKQKTIKDIARYIKNQTDHVPNFCLLLGAGCSVSSGIRSGETLVTEWRKEVYEQLSSRPSNEAYTDEDAKNYLKENEQSWYSPSKEYSSLFERKFDLPRQRRMFVEKEVTGKSPSIGYAYFINIINKRFFNTIFTTNFDDLVNEAFYLFSNERPIICAHDSAISSVTVTSSRPKIIKLHGDYLFDDIKTTLRETETLEQNMQAKFIEFAKDYGLIVIGYSGGDRSIMDTLNQLQKNDDYYKNGIYWCLRHNTEVNEDLRKLLRHERVFYVLIDGFDEFMAEVHEELFDEELPISTSTFTRKPVEIISGFMQNSQTTNTSSKKIKCDLEKLKRVSGKNSLFELIKEIELKDDAKVSREIDDQELISLLEISQCFDNEKYEDVIEKSKALIEASNDNDTKIRGMQRIFQAYKKQGDIRNAMNYVDQLCAIDSQNPSYSMMKLPLLSTFEEKITLIDSVIEKNEFYLDSYAKKASLFVDQMDRLHGLDREKLANETIAIYEKSIKINPSIRNSSWDFLYQFIHNYYTKSDKKSKLSNIIETLKEQDALHPKIIALSLIDLSKKTHKSEQEIFIKKIEETKKRTHHNQGIFDKLEIDALIKFCRYEEAEKKIKITKEPIKDEFFIAKQEAELQRKKYGDLKKVEEILSYINKTEKSISTSLKVIDTRLLLDKKEEAKAEFKKIEKELEEDDRIKTKIKILEHEGCYEDAINLANDLHEPDSTMQKSYLMLLDKKYENAKKITSDFLQKVNYSLEFGIIIVNYELSKKQTGGKVDKTRLEKLVEFEKEYLTKAAIYCLLEQFEDALSNMKEALEEDISDFRTIKKWPVFSTFIERGHLSKIEYLIP